MKRKVSFQVKGHNVIDGAGVNLTRVLGNRTVEIFDPILMLDSFDSIDPKDYTAGFPTHPHRGIETISYLVKGKMTHKDSLGNEDTITDGEIQWMTAGSGIMHSEELPASDRILGVQLWLNLSQKNKMVIPEYTAIKKDEIKEIEMENGKLKLLAGKYKDTKGFKSKYLPLNYYDIQLNANSKFKLDVDENSSIMIFTLLGKIIIDGKLIDEKTAVKFSTGNSIEFLTKEDSARILFMESIPLNEPVSWGGPIVMNSRFELEKAFKELEEGTFLKNKIKY